MIALGFLATFALGVVAWTLTEYVAHRFTMHNVGGRGPAAGEHLRHHAQPLRTRPVVRVLGHISMYATAVGIAVVLALMVPPALAIAAALGWAFGYTIYEALHHAAHHYRPRGNWDLRLRKRHFHHHFVAPRQNLGVTITWWDQVFRTEGPVGPIRVPRRLAMPWLLDDHGRVQPQFADDYVLVGRARPLLTRDELQAQDLERAFSDLAPSTD